MIASNADHYVTVRRTTARLLAPATATATMTPDRQPVRASRLKVRVAGGTTGSGTVTVAGTVNGSAGSETLTFSGNAVLTSDQMFTAIDTNGITTSGLVGESTVATVTVEAVDESGSPQSSTYTLVAGRPAVFTPRALGDWPIRREGGVEFDKGVFLLEYEETWSPRPGDEVVDDEDGAVWEVVSTRTIPAVSRPLHFEIQVALRG